MSKMLIFALDHSFGWVRSRRLLFRFTLLARILLAAGFIPTGFVKMLGQRFTLLPESTPIGAFFEAMYQTGGFWSFIGAVQVVAGVLLLMPPFAHLGALLFLPVIACIFAAVVGVGFGTGTTLVTLQMLLAVLYLLLWDYDRFRSILTTHPFQSGHSIPAWALDRWERAGFIVFAVALIAYFAFTRSFVPVQVGRAALWVGLAAGAFTLLRFLVVSTRREVQTNDRW